jgi:uncharacterized protein with GYD domain
MAKYVTLLKFSEKAAANIKDTCKRAGELKTHEKKHGIQVHEQYWCLGRFDGLIIFEAPDDETATAAMLSLSARGFVSTQTMRSFSAAEMGEIARKLA